MRKILADSGESRCQVSIPGNQNNLANLELISTTGRPVHTQGNVHISLFFLKLPDGDLILPGGFLPLDEPRRITFGETMIPQGNRNASSLQGTNLSMLSIIRSLATGGKASDHRRGEVVDRCHH